MREERPLGGGAPLDLCAELGGHGSSRNTSYEEAGVKESTVLQHSVQCVDFLYACVG